MTHFLTALTATGSAGATSATLAHDVDSGKHVEKAASDFATFVQPRRQWSHADIGDATNLDAETKVQPEDGATIPALGEAAEVHIPPIPARAQPAEPEPNGKLDPNAEPGSRPDSQLASADRTLFLLNSSQRSQLPDPVAHSVFVKDPDHRLQGPDHVEAVQTDESASAVKSNPREASDNRLAHSQPMPPNIGQDRQINPVGKSLSDKANSATGLTRLGRSDPLSAQEKPALATPLHSPSRPESSAVVQSRQNSDNKPSRIDDRTAATQVDATKPQMRRAGPTNIASKSIPTIAGPIGASVSFPTKEALLSATGTSDQLHFDGTSGPTHSQTNTTTNPASMTRFDMARNVAQQMQAAMPSTADRPVDLSLNPDELGKVKLSITTTNGSVVLQVLAERPETLDLMRRHADILAEELGDLGFDSIDLSFGQGQSEDLDNMPDNQPGGQTGHSSARVEDDTILTPEPENTRLSIALDGSGGLDIRV